MLGEPAHDQVPSIRDFLWFVHVRNLLSVAFPYVRKERSERGRRGARERGRLVVAGQGDGLVYFAYTNCSTIFRASSTVEADRIASVAALKF
jgi:hypothetical protein